MQAAWKLWVCLRLVFSMLNQMVRSQEPQTLTAFHEYLHACSSLCSLDNAPLQASTGASEEAESLGMAAPFAVSHILNGR